MNKQEIEGLQDKLSDIDRLIKGLKEVTNQMKDNPDYEVQQGSVQKLAAALKTLEAKRDGLLEQKKELEKATKEQEAELANSKSLDVNELGILNSRVGRTKDDVKKFKKDVDATFTDLMKKRRKLGDADIGENSKKRQDESKEMGDKLSQMKADAAELERLV